MREGKGEKKRERRDPGRRRSEMIAGMANNSCIGVHGQGEEGGGRE